VTESAVSQYDIKLEHIWNLSSSSSGSCEVGTEVQNNLYTQYSSSMTLSA
jgi:hypothetical protein